MKKKYKKIATQGKKNKDKKKQLTVVKTKGKNK